MPAVRQPQRKFLAVLFATTLALRGRVTGRKLSQYCDYYEHTMAHQFRTSFAWPAFHQRVITATLDPRAERGLVISTLAVVDVTRRCAFTLAIAQTPLSDKEARSEQAEDETRMDFYKQQLRDQRQRLPPCVTYHYGDGHFAKKK